MIDFLKLPVDIQDDIVMMCNFDVATYKVFKNKYFHLLQNHSNMIRIMDDVIVHSKNEVLCLLIKDGFLNEANLIGVLHRISWKESHMDGLCMLIALCAVLKWHEVGMFVLNKINDLKVWDIQSLLNAYSH
jgi:hypothetical protein